MEASRNSIQRVVAAEIMYLWGLEFSCFRVSNRSPSTSSDIKIDRHATTLHRVTPGRREQVHAEWPGVRVGVVTQFGIKYHHPRPAKSPCAGNLRTRGGGGGEERDPSEFEASGRERENTRKYPQSYREDGLGKSGPQAHGVRFLLSSLNKTRAPGHTAGAHGAGLLLGRSPGLRGGDAPSSRLDSSVSKYQSATRCAVATLIVILSPLSSSFLREPTVPREKLAE